MKTITLGILADPKNAGAIFHPGVFVGGMSTGAKRAGRGRFDFPDPCAFLSPFLLKNVFPSLKIRGARLEGAVKKAFTRGFL
jgi:hypothetical protein